MDNDISNDVREPAAAAHSAHRNVLPEGLMMGVFWICMAVWVLTSCRLFGYLSEPADVPLALGMPAWVVWGVLVPWCVSTAFTTWFALYGMTDEDRSDLSDHQDG